MSTDFSYDPVTAVDEAAATGKTAEIFADIRATLGIPLVTSIWRGLAGMDNSLQVTWRAAKPIYGSGQVKPALDRVVAATGLPPTEVVTPAQLARAGIDRQAFHHIRTIVRAYNRSNGMNLVALAALICDEPEPRPEAVTIRAPQWVRYPALLAREAIADDTWDLVRRVNAFGARGIDANVATLWRHLAHWPGFLTLAHDALAPRQADGSIAAATRRMVKLAAAEGARLASFKDDAEGLSAQARQTITGYVTTPTQVVRMVTLGHTLFEWIAAPGADD